MSLKQSALGCVILPAKAMPAAHLLLPTDEKKNKNLNYIPL